MPPSELSLSVTIDVPRVRYYLYLMGAFDRGLITPDLVLDWFNIVDERHILIIKFFRKHTDSRISSESSGRGRYF